ncbi:MAG: hypothetical protein HOC24_14145 [Deltaproteobacteria bacterium]|nr:hypothetical protein [Deltaproteobacteria bacterium]
MVAPDRIWLLFAITISLLFHISIISPLSSWLNQVFIPNIYDEGIEIQLLEDELPELKKEVPVEEPVEDPVMAEPPPSDDQVDKVYQNLPDFTKNLSETAVEDEIILPEKEDAGLKDGEETKLDQAFFEKLLEAPLDQKPVNETEHKPDEIIDTEEEIPETINPENDPSQVEKEMVTDRKPIPLISPEPEKSIVNVIGSEPVSELDNVQVIEPQSSKLMSDFASIPETIVEPEAETIVEPEAETIVEPEAETIVEPEAETIVEPEAETIVESEAETIVESKQEAAIVASISPLFRVTPNAKKPVDETPEIIKKSFRGIKPERTNEDTIQFSMNTYKWTYERYMENWAVDLSRWWSAPTDYRLGKIPDGGNVWVRVRLQKTGKLLGYKVFDSNLTAEMELSVIQALIGSLERPSLPEAFPEKELIINWKFIYPPIDAQVNLRRKRK